MAEVVAFALNHDSRTESIGNSPLRASNGCQKSSRVEDWERATRCARGDCYPLANLSRYND